MTREEYLQFCKVCKNQKFDLKYGIVCGLTKEIANFDTNCLSYQEDPELKKKEEQVSVTRNIEGKTVSQGVRFVNYLIDIFFLMIFNVAIGVVIAIYEEITSTQVAFFQSDNRLLDYAFGFVTGMIYFTFFEGTTGRTMGKLITGTKVVDKEGNRPDIQTILIRSLCRFIPFEAFSFLGDDASGWHDTLSKTKVIKSSVKIDR